MHRSSSRRPHFVALLAALFAFTGLADPARAANQNVSLSGVNFSPRNVTINAGESVTWTNNGGTHNVVADDNSFRCANGCDDQGGNGDLSSANWSFSRTFSSPGTIAYHCAAHGAAGGVGMSGTVTVLAVGSPGTLAFSGAGYSGGEGGGAVTITVKRTDGSQGAVSVDYSTADGTAVAGSDFTATSGTLNWADGDSSDKTFQVAILDDAEVEGSETFTVSLASPSGGASLGSPATASVAVSSNDTPSSSGSIRFTAASANVAENAGSVTLSLERTGGSSGAVSVNWATANGTATAGADFTAANGSVSFGDGETGPKSIQVTIADDTTEESSESFSVALSAPSGGAALGSPASATVTINDNDAIGPCVADATTLCLNEGRFRVRMRWTDFQSVTRDAKALTFRSDSGFFYFVDDSNLEVLVKVLNGCGVNNKFWVFFAAATNTGFTLTVTDTHTGISKPYTNPLGAFPLTVGDTGAFGGCS